MKLNFRNPENFEVGWLQGHSRKLVVVGTYMPPNNKKERVDTCMEYKTNLMIEYKRNYRVPYIILEGDFNQWRVEQAMADFLEIREMLIGATTRCSRTIDHILMNNHRIIKESGTLNPLKTDAEDQQEVRTSDYRIVPRYMPTSHYQG